jgi:hypothetical protein
VTHASRTSEASENYEAPGHTSVPVASGLSGYLAFGIVAAWLIGILIWLRRR